MEKSMEGRVCVVTGANSGIGKATALGLARMGADVVMVCRNRDLGEAAQRELREQTKNPRLELLIADLSSLADVRKCAEAIKGKHAALHVLVNNAAIMPRHRVESRDGYELQFAVNHLAPFLLTNLLMDLLKAGAPSRVVNVSSVAHRGASLNFDDLQHQKSYSAYPVYKRTKLMNILFTYELARRLRGAGVTANCLHPGLVRTNFVRDLDWLSAMSYKVVELFFMVNPEKGAETSIYCATSAELEGVTGKYFDKCRETASSEVSHDEALAKRLWDVSAELAGLGAA